MNEAVSSGLHGRSEGRDEDHGGAVTYTIRVLEGAARDDGREMRTVMFRRTGHGESIELSARTDTPNLLARLPDFLDAALELQHALPPEASGDAGAAHAAGRLADEARLLRRLTELPALPEQPGAEPGAPRAPRVLELIGAAYRARRGSAGPASRRAAAP